MTTKKHLSEIAKSIKGTFRNDYSGRGMMGRLCYGIDCETAEANYVIEQAAMIGITGAKTDSMGKGTIVYWPNIIIPAN